MMTSIEIERTLKDTYQERIELLRRRIWDAVYLDYWMSVSLKEFMDDQLLFLLIEIHRLLLVTDKEHAMTRYYSIRVPLLQLQGYVLRLLPDANRRERKRIGVIDGCLAELLGLLEGVKEMQTA